MGAGSTRQSVCVGLALIAQVGAMWPGALVALTSVTLHSLIVTNRPTLAHSYSPDFMLPISHILCIFCITLLMLFTKSLSV